MLFKTVLLLLLLLLLLILLLPLLGARLGAIRAQKRDQVKTYPLVE